MTDFGKVTNYYQLFDEDARLQSTASGRMEYEMTLKRLLQHLPENATILDLGGASGTYSFPLASLGHRVYLADLSDKLIMQAKEKLKRSPNQNLVSCDVVNALDLSRYPDQMFDAVLVMGPLYHLLEERERAQCVQEVNRVLKPDGLVFAAFIPYLSGSIAIVDRYFFSPSQVDAENLQAVFRTGQFRNNANVGFQEGYYPTSAEICTLFSNAGFSKIRLASIRSFAYGREEQLEKLQSPSMRSTILQLAENMCELPEIVETCGHALYIGKKA